MTVCAGACPPAPPGADLARQEGEAAPASRAASLPAGRQTGQSVLYLNTRHSQCQVILEQINTILCKY